MSHKIVKILVNEDGEKERYPKWHLSVEACGDNNTFCSNEFYGFGAGTMGYKVKSVEKGGITCPDCLEKIKEIKSIKL